MGKSQEELAKLAVFHANYHRFKQELSDVMGQKLTQEDIAAITGIGIDGIRQYEGGKRRAETDALQRLAAAFGRPMEDWNNPKPPEVDRSKLPGFVVVRPKVIGANVNPAEVLSSLQELAREYGYDMLVQRTKAKAKLRTGKRR